MAALLVVRVLAAARHEHAHAEPRPRQPGGRVHDAAGAAAGARRRGRAAHLPALPRRGPGAARGDPARAARAAHHHEDVPRLPGRDAGRGGQAAPGRGSAPQAGAEHAAGEAAPLQEVSSHREGGAEAEK